MKTIEMLEELTKDIEVDREVEKELLEALEVLEYVIM